MLSGKCTNQLERSKRLADVEDDSKLLLQFHKVPTRGIELLHLPCCPNKIPREHPDHLPKLVNPPYCRNNLAIEPPQPALRLVEGLRPQRDLSHEVRLHNVEMLSEALL